MQLYNVASQTEIGINLPKVVNENHQTGEDGRYSGGLTNEVSKSFPDNSDGRAECLFDLPKVEKQSYKATGYKAWTTELSRLVRPLCKH